MPTTKDMKVKFTSNSFPTTYRTACHNLLESIVESSEQRTIWNFSFPYYIFLQIETISWTTNYVMTLSTVRLFNKRHCLLAVYRVIKTRVVARSSDGERMIYWFVVYVILSTRFEDFTQALLNIQVCWVFTLWCLFKLPRNENVPF